MKIKTWTILVVILFLLGVGGSGFYYFQQQQKYLITDNAQVAAEAATLHSKGAGRIGDWNIAVGDRVRGGQQLGWQTGSEGQQVIRAPITGQVVASGVDSGESVTSGRPLAMVADLEHRYIRAYIDETEMDDVQVGQEAEVILDADPDRRIHGEVSRIGSEAGSEQSSSGAQGESREVQRVPVQITLDDPDQVPPVIGLNAQAILHK